MDAERSAGPASAAPRFGILGPLQVVDTGHRPVPLGGPRARELLALMLLNPNRPLSAERLVTALWGEGASEGAATTLRTHVATVRRVLAAAGVGETLTTHPSGYVLDLHRGDLDADVFEGLVHRGQEALGVGDPGQAAAILTRALDLWRGDVLSDLGPPDFADTTVARLEELRVVAEETAMAAALALGQHREVVPRLQELVAAHPFHEQLSAQLVLALYRSGRQVDALTAYAETKQRLGEELGLDPGPDLQALETAVLRQDPALLLSVESLGRSESTSRHPAARQPPDAVFAALRRIPMVGRDAGLRTLREAWQETLDGGRGIVAVSGTAGVGKSRLAAELAQLAEVDGAAVLIGRCDASVPYAALSSALGASGTVRQVVAEAPPGVRARLHPLVPLDPDAEIEPHGAGDTEERQALVRSVEWVLASLAADGPVLFVVEDAERLDDVESGVLAAIGTRLPERILLVVCFRDPPGSRHPPLAGLVGRRGLHELTRTIFLESLSREDLGEMVASMHPAAGEVARPFVEALWQQTAGNPFFAREVLRDVETADLRSGRLRHDLPAGVRDVLRHRLGSLAADTREAVAAAAVLGREVELGRLSRLLQEPEDRVVTTRISWSPSCSARAAR